MDRLGLHILKIPRKLCQEILSKSNNLLAKQEILAVFNLSSEVTLNGLWIQILTIWLNPI